MNVSRKDQREGPMRTSTLLSGVAALATAAASLYGCSHAEGVNSLPATGNLARHETRFAVPEKKQVKIEEFRDLPRYGSYYYPTALTAGSDGQLWIADDVDQDIGDSAVARVATSGKRTRTYYYYASATPSFLGIAEGSDRAYWLTDWADGLIIRLTTQGMMTRFPVKDSDLSDIVAGPDGALWFDEGDAVGRITTKGRLTIYATSRRDPAGLRRTTYLDDLGVQDITVGPDGALWFTNKNANAVGRITTAGKLTEYTSGISAGAGLTSIASGADGALWFTEMNGGRIGRITTSGKVTEYSSGITPGEQPVGIAGGSDNAMWFTEYEGYSSYTDAKIGRITLHGKITEYSNLDPSSGPTAIIQGPDHNMWFVEYVADRLGRVDLSGN
jgi:virginiamycin B lyase